MLKLRPSSSDRWIACPGSVFLEQGIEDKPSIYAQEGIDAHECAAKLLELEIYPRDTDPHILAYVTYVKDIMDKIKNPTIFIEKKLDIISNEKILIEGTADCIVLDKENKTIHVIDLKYGKGIEIFAENNKQLLLYSMGAYVMIENLFSAEKISMHIVQPRTNNFCMWTISKEEMEFWRKTMDLHIDNILKPEPIRIPSPKTCRFCKAKPTCPELQQEQDPIRHFNKI